LGEPAKAIISFWEFDSRRFLGEGRVDQYILPFEMPEPNVADASHPHPLSEATSPMGGRGLIPGPTAFLVPCLHEVFSIRPVMSAEAKFMLAGHRSIASKVGPECVHNEESEAGVSVLHERAAQLTLCFCPQSPPGGRYFRWMTGR
jgi:hypothetical protein